MLLSRALRQIDKKRTVSIFSERRSEDALTALAYVKIRTDVRSFSTNVEVLENCSPLLGDAFIVRHVSQPILR